VVIKKIDSLNILIVCEDEICSDEIGSKLDNVENIYKAQNAKEGLKLYIKYKPDIIFCSTTVEDLESTNFVKKIKFGSNISTFLLFNKNKEYSPLSSINDGVDYFLNGEITKESLNEAVTKCHTKNLEKNNQDTLLSKLKGIFDSSPNISMLCKGNEIVEVNSKFFEFFDCKDLKEFKENIGIFGSQIATIEEFPTIQDPKNWLGELIKLPPQQRKIGLRSYAAKLCYFFVCVARFQQLNGHFTVTLTDITLLEKEYKSKIQELKSASTQVKPAQNPQTQEQKDCNGNGEDGLTKILKILGVELHRSNRYGTPVSCVLLTYTNPEGGEIKSPSIPGIMVKLIKGKTRPTDFDERVTKNKFLVILTHTNIDGCSHFMDRLLEELYRSEILRDYNCVYKIVGAEHRKNESLTTLLKRLNNFMSMISKLKGDQKILAEADSVSS